eukprot:CAMPEP_0116825914 /NCGR_PEP_ID=MMETSP0418-20121206/2241_1 /TAXON_ID=1158023 /ORGANISM="Astrosyne radiata, Strain 13vi08-1A" /LENGTH=288 /DNA_ID=CAMNT_0004454497 /DNA_START=214 /DNA_END=1081 /DNA_ORIENTATION=-
MRVVSSVVLSSPLIVSTLFRFGVSAISPNSNASTAATVAFVPNQSFPYNRSSSSSRMTTAVDQEYPGTAVERLVAVHERVKEVKDSLNGPWKDIRRKLLWAGGLRDLPNARPGEGYTGHSFNDYNHVDLTTMMDQVSDNENDGNVRVFLRAESLFATFSFSLYGLAVQIVGIARGNFLGKGIQIASLPELGPGGSWSTCANGCNQNPPQDVAHIQFQSRIAFKLVWCPTDSYNVFVLVDDDGALLAKGVPTGDLPSLDQRVLNYQLVRGSKYAVEADKVAALQKTKDQ